MKKLLRKLIGIDAESAAMVNRYRAENEDLACVVARIKFESQCLEQKCMDKSARISDLEARVRDLMLQLSDARKKYTSLCVKSRRTCNHGASRKNGEKISEKKSGKTSIR